MPAWMIGGAAALGFGGNLLTGFMGQSAAKKGAAQEESALYAALGQQQGTQNLMLNYFDPFRTMGLQAGQALTGELYSPQQQIQQSQASLDTLNRQLQTLWQQAKGLETGQGVPILQGYKASERRATVWQQMIEQNHQQTAAIQQQIAAQKSQLARAQDMAKNPNALSDLITSNPMYTAAANAASRQLAAQGLQGSQEAIRQEGTLAANVFQNQIGNQLEMYRPAVAGSAGMAGNIMQSGQGMAQTLGGIGQAQSAGTIGASNSVIGGITGASNSLSGAGSALLNYGLYSKLFSGGGLGGANTGQDYQMAASKYSNDAANPFYSWTPKSMGQNG